MEPDWELLEAIGPMLGGKCGHIGSNWDQLEGTGTMLRGLETTTEATPIILGATGTTMWARDRNWN